MPTPYSPGEGKEKPKARRFALEKSVGNLDQNSRAIAGLRIAPASAAMGQIDQNLYAFENDVVRLPPLDAGDKPDAASVVLMLRAVKSLSRRQCLEMGTVHSCEPESTIQGGELAGKNTHSIRLTDSTSSLERHSLLGLTI